MSVFSPQVSSSVPQHLHRTCDPNVPGIDRWSGGMMTRDIICTACKHAPPRAFISYDGAVEHAFAFHPSSSSPCNSMMTHASNQPTACRLQAALPPHLGIQWQVATPTRTSEAACSNAPAWSWRTLDYADTMRLESMREGTMPDPWLVPEGPRAPYTLSFRLMAWYSHNDQQHCPLRRFPPLEGAPVSAGEVAPSMGS